MHHAAHTFGPGSTVIVGPAELVGLELFAENGYAEATLIRLSRDGARSGNPLDTVRVVTPEGARVAELERALAAAADEMRSYRASLSAIAGLLSSAALELGEAPSRYVALPRADIDSIGKRLGEFAVRDGALIKRQLLQDTIAELESFARALGRLVAEADGEEVTS